jgi:hypothetical protein
MSLKSIRQESAKNCSAKKFFVNPQSASGNPRNLSGRAGAKEKCRLVLGKSLHFGILPDPNPNPAFNRIRANPDLDPGSLGFI